ncbi:hypothetical protein ACJZL1_01495 [Wolbachia endosymbiont of Rhagoletis indifferens]
MLAIAEIPWRYDVLAIENAHWNGKNLENNVALLNSTTLDIINLI